MPTAHVPSVETSRPRIVESLSATYLRRATSNASRNVKSRSRRARIICADWMKRSAVRQTSTFAVESLLSTAAVSAAGVCGIAPRNTRAPSALQVSGARSLITQPSGKPDDVASSVAGASFGSRSAARTSGTTRSTLSRCSIFATSSPLSTARPFPASFHARRA